MVWWRTGVNLLDYSADIDHNRSVFTMTGTEQIIKKCCPQDDGFWR